MENGPTYTYAELTDKEKLNIEPLAASRVRVVEDTLHVMSVFVDGKEIRDVRAVRVFPISAKADYVSFIDNRDKEVAILAHPRKLDHESRKVLEAALERMYYVPKIIRVDSIRETAGVNHWEVQTDRGYASFEIVDREHIRSLPGNRYLLIDADGNRYEIENVAKLDKRSKDLIHSET